MKVSIEETATLERVNYEANWTIAQITPGLEICLRDDVVFTSSEVFPSPDMNHACLLQATVETVDELIIAIINYFSAKELPPTIFISPACTPPDLPQRLADHGFESGDKEAWMTLDNLSERDLPLLNPTVLVKQITRSEVMTFASTFMAGFEMPLELAPSMAYLIEPSVGLPSVRHYLAYIDGQPVGTYSLICHKHYGIIGSASVVPAFRRKKAARNLTISAIKTAQQQGVNTLMLQTTAGFLLERLLGICGFRKVFTRIAYTLS